jgi:hypothetical protein
MITKQTVICAITNKPCPTPRTECCRCSTSRDAKLSDWTKKQLLENRQQYIESLQMSLEDFMKKLRAIELN